MNHRILPQDDLILQTIPSVADDAYSVGSTFTLQDRVEAIQQSSEEFYQMVSKRSALYEGKNVPTRKKRTGFRSHFSCSNVHKVLVDSSPRILMKNDVFSHREPKCFFGIFLIDVFLFFINFFSKQTFFQSAVSVKL